VLLGNGFINVILIGYVFGEVWSGIGRFYKDESRERFS
jgi:hypothetical protein